MDETLQLLNSLLHSDGKEMAGGKDGGIYGIYYLLLEIIREINSNKKTEDSKSGYDQNKYHASDSLKIQLMGLQIFGHSFHFACQGILVFATNPFE